MITDGVKRHGLTLAFIKVIVIRKLCVMSRSNEETSGESSEINTYGSVKVKWWSWVMDGRAVVKSITEAGFVWVVNVFSIVLIDDDDFTLLIFLYD